MYRSQLGSPSSCLTFFSEPPIRYQSPTTEKHARTRSGFSLIEVVVAMTVLSVALLALTTTLAATHSLNMSVEQRTRAEAVVRSAAEEIIALSDASIGSAAGWSQTMTDALSDGGSYGIAFDVRGLNPLNGAQRTGSILVVTNEQVRDADLGVSLGLPRDLDGDGFVANADVSSTARILPVVLEVRWAGKLGPQRVTEGFFLLGYE